MAERVKQAQEAQLPRGQDPRAAPKIELGGGRHPAMWRGLCRGGLPEEHCPWKGGSARFGMPWGMFLVRSADQHGPGGDSGGPRHRAWLRNVGRSGFAAHPGGEAMAEDEMRAVWLRRVQSDPADFLRNRFAYQLWSNPAKSLSNGGVLEY